MKKILSLLLVLSLLPMVIAEDVGQGGSGTVGTDFSVIFNPTSLDFGNIVAGSSASLLNEIIGTNSHLEIDGISVTPDDAEGIFNNDNVLFSMTDSDFVTGDVFTTPAIEIPVLGTVDFYVQMNVPSGTSTGPFSGTITYTIMEYMP